MLQITILIASIFLLLGVQLLRAYLAHIFPTYHARALPAGIPAPAACADLYQRAHEQLTALGFEGPFWFLRDAEPANAITYRVAAAYRHTRDCAVCWLLPPSNGRAPNLLLTYLATRFADGRVTISQAWDPYFEVTATPDAPAQTVTPANLALHRDAHHSWVAGLRAQPDPAFCEAQAMLDFAGAWFNRQREQLLERGSLRRDADGTVRARFGFALRMLGAYLRRAKPPKDNAPIPAARLAGLAAVVERVRATAPPARVQWALFGGSMLLFAGLGAWIWSPRYALLILIVIGIHELGHFLAMRAFGYRNVHMLALPLIGGVTIGQETVPSATKRAWMSLMGPLPGIVIGWTLLLAQPWFAQSPTVTGWLNDAALLFLFINYLNILPIPPLDGGRVVQAMLPPRWHVLQVGVVAVTCVVGAVGAIALGMTAIAMLALLQLTTLPAVVQGGRVLRALLADGAPVPQLARNLRLRHVLDVFERVIGPARQAIPRINQAEAVLGSAEQMPMRWWQRSVLGAVLLALLAVPAAAGAIYVMALAPHTDAQRMQVDVQALRKQRAELEQSAHSTSLADLVHELAGADAQRADDAALQAAAARLSAPLPDELATLYRSANGLQSQGLAPVEQLARSQRAELEPLMHNDVVEVDDADGTNAQVTLERAMRWIRLGEPGTADTQLFYDADAQPAVAGHRLISVDDDQVSAQQDLHAYLESNWVSQRMFAKMNELRDAQQAREREALRNASVAQLLAQFPQPSLVERLVLHRRGAPPPADARSIAAAEQRIGRPLPDDLLAVYRQRDGLLPYLHQVEWLDRTDAWPPARGTLDMPRQLAARDFTLIDDTGAVTRMVRIDAATLASCVVLAATSYPAADGLHLASPRAWWCPAGDAQPERWVALQQLRVYSSFRVMLLDAAAGWRTQHGAAF